MKLRSPLSLSFLLFIILGGTLFAQTTPIRYTYLGQFNTLGVPDYLEESVERIDQDFQNDINATLPERISMVTNNPSFISRENSADLALGMASEIWVSFLHEGTNSRNTFGFYTYPTANPPRTAAEIRNRTVVFPNTSYETSGGGMKTGQTVYLGRFDATTSIGWFLVVDGFLNGKVTNGKYILYSEAGFNPASNALLKSHTALIKDAKREKLLLGFEETIRMPGQGSDHDFNELILLISASPFKAIANQAIPDLSKPSVQSPDKEDWVQNPTTIEVEPLKKLPEQKVDASKMVTILPPAEPNVCSQNGFSNDKFSALKKTVRAQTTERNKPTIIMQAVINRKLTVFQVKELIKLVLIEQYKIDLAKSLFDYTCDKSNYFEVNSLLIASRVRELNEFLKGKDLTDETSRNPTSPTKNQPRPSTTAPCEEGQLPQPVFDKLTATIKAKDLAEEKLSALKVGIYGQCLTSEQAVLFLNLLSFEVDVLNAAKFLYPFTVDKYNYADVFELLLYPRSKKELEDYIKTVK